CIECDENQHRDRDKKDEEIRYDDLMMIHGGKFIFIRINPDKFIDKNGLKTNPTIDERLLRLSEVVEHQMARIYSNLNKELLEIINMYFDEI
ncbi:hypothetical protein RXP12_28990, partial [Pseudomonas aeruginosa]|nr:hypothetical protein [Pseudomonas aeruginosa]